MSIVFKNVCFAYKKKNVLENISVTIKEKQLVAIIGPNGGGKTSFLRLCTGDLEPQTGFVKVATKQKHSVGFVPQNVHYDPKFPITVLEVVLGAFIQEAKLFGKYPESCIQKALKILETLNLLEYQDQRFGDLSTGLAQRVLIARALVDNPEILLLDEPTASVDPQARKAILDLIQLWKNKITIAIVTHDIEMTIDIVDQVLCLETTLTCFHPNDICKHFGIGLYHAPLKTDRL